MAEQYDITLGGTGFSVAPKSYRRGLDSAGNLGAAPVRQVQRAWAGSQRPIQAERDRFASSLGLLPLRAAGGAAVVAGPRETDYTVTGFATLKRRFHVLVEGRPYTASGGALWRPERTGSGLYPNNLGGFTQVGATLGQEITGLCTDGVSSIFASRAGAGYAMWPVGGSAWNLTAVIQLQGCAWFLGALWGGNNDPNGWQIVRATSGSSIADAQPIDSKPLSFLVARDALYITTANALYRLTGKIAGGTFTGGLEQVAGFGGLGFGGDGTALAEYNGEIYTYIGGEICKYHSGGNSPARWQRTGLRGIACRGLAAAAGYLVAALVDSTSSTGTSLWCYDGTGWWCIARNLDGAHDYSAPSSTAGYFDNADILAYGYGLARAHAYQMQPRASQPGLAASGELITSLWFGRDADAEKVWARVGAEMGTIVREASAFDAVTVALDFSTDGGMTWATAATAAITTPGPATVAGPLPAGTRARAIALRWRVSGVNDGCPVLNAVWAEYRGIEAATHRLAWELEIMAGDGAVRRDGGADVRRGGAIAAALWALFRAGGTLTYRDVDYDRDPVERQVRIATLTESVRQPGDAGRWGESMLKVRLVEVG